MGLTVGAKRDFGEFLHDRADAERQAAFSESPRLGR